MSVLAYLQRVRREKGAGYLALLDPDKLSGSALVDTAACCAENGVDALLIGSSLMFTTEFDATVRQVKRHVEIPVILFPGASHHLSRHADAMLFLSLLSGRNPQYLIGEQVRAAPIVHALGIEPIATGYLLIESGAVTSAEFMSDTRPIPRDKPSIAVAHALAAEYLGMRLVYLEAGSGARLPVPEPMIAAVCAAVSIPVMVGGGIRSPQVAAEKVAAGADFLVTGNVLEEEASARLIRELADAVHSVRSGTPAEAEHPGEDTR
jgi:phosphoglycerol geranylgeranyltransferase